MSTEREKAADDRLKKAIDEVIFRADSGDQDEDYYSIAVANQVAVDEARELLLWMSSSHMPNGTCWCEPSRNIKEFGHMKRCTEIATWLSRHKEE